ncbi:unnamed protein product [Medioppia subpectinata]|uniref:VWFC domain-containing protein n=2 Tax=Medioppia subpectinata TaxID=1979941 RepID=A0A7R9PWI3_9ACAR|nr:unnamed protein product [Medioppia subpectinata]CAG2103953.1 unnamed protein product [Medioppia subpectinata]
MTEMSDTIITVIINSIMNTNHKVMALIALLLAANNISAYSSGQLTSVDMCFNDKGEIVKQGEQYFPLGSDICTQCTCQNGRPEMCISVLCSPPHQCRQFHAVNGKCCEFVCLDGDFSGANKLFNTSIIRGNGGDNRTHGSVATNNLGLRLIASTITSFLILALLLFMIHRLRQRRLLLMIRRLQTRRLEQVNGLSADNNPHMGYLSSQNCYDQYDFGGSFNEPPPPYTFWKPPEHYIPPGEAPPPYDDSVDITIVPCFDLNSHSVNNNNYSGSRVNITNNCIVGSPTPFQQTQLISAANRQSPYVRGTPFLMMRSATPPTMTGGPIIDTISDQCYQHITVVRINDSQTHNNSTMSSANDDNICAEDIAVENSNTLSDSTSTSSIASSEEAFNSPSNCSVISSSSQSTSTQSTVRRQDNDTISRL